MKKIFVLIILSLLGFACSKSEDENRELVSWKSGVFTNSSTNQQSLMITFFHPFQRIEMVRFEADWKITSGGKTYSKKLTEFDFVWSNEENKLEGIYNLPLQIGEYQRADVESLSGYVQILGEWRKMRFDR